MSYQFDGEFIEKFYLTFTMLAYESNRRFYPVGEVVGPMDKYKFTRNEVDMLFFLNSCVDKKVKPQHDFKDNRHEHTQSVHTSARFHGNHLPQCGKACPKRACGKILSQQQPQNSLRQSYGKGYQTQRGALGVFGSEYKETF